MRVLVALVAALWANTAFAQSSVLTAVTDWTPQPCPSIAQQSRDETFTDVVDPNVNVATGPTSRTTKASRQCQPAPPPPPPNPGPMVSMGFPHGVPWFCAGATAQTVKAGLWSDPTTWYPPVVPQAGAIVSVWHGVTYSGTQPPLACVELRQGGQLRFTPAAVSLFQAQTLAVYPGASLESGTVTAPITGSVEIVFLSTPINTTLDPEQVGNGLVGLGGTITMSGRPLPAFVRLQADVKAGTPVPTIQGWGSQDRVLLPDMRQLTGNASYTPQWEVTTQGAAAQFSHLAIRDLDGADPWYPHMANLSRNVVMRSENPNGVRGHTIFTNQTDLDIRYALFKDLGRTTTNPLNNTTWNGNTVTRVGTNQIGRYAVHIHHVRGLYPAQHPNQFTLIGNAVDGGPKWGIAIHASHYGLVEGNVVYNVGGGGLVTEDGSESFNQIRGNYVAAVFGSGGTGIQRGNTDMFWEGCIYCFRGQNNYVEDNVATDTLNDYGFKLQQYGFSRGTIVSIPLVPGADPMNPAQWERKPLLSIPVLKFSGNDAYGAMQGCYTYWWIGTESNQPVARMAESVLSNIRCGNPWLRGVLHYPANHVTIDGFSARASTQVNRETAFFFGADYLARDVQLKNGNVQGFTIAYYPSVNSSHDPDVPGLGQGLSNTFMRTSVGIMRRTFWTSGSNAADPNLIGPRDVGIDTVRWVQPPFNRIPVKAIEQEYTTVDGRNIIQRDRMILSGWQGDPSANYELFRSQQAATFIVPPSRLRPNGVDFAFVGAPASGLTNAQLWAQYGKAVNEAVMPSVGCTSLPQVDGQACRQ